MSLPAWPNTLPQEAQLGSWKLPEAHAPNTITDMNAGTIRARRAHSLAVSRVQFDMVLNSTQLDIFWAFYFGTIHSGAARFTMPVWNGKAYVTKTCRMRSATGPQASEFAHERARISLDLVVESLFA
jgi:hypothetical protein